MNNEMEGMILSLSGLVGGPLIIWKSIRDLNYYSKLKSVPRVGGIGPKLPGTFMYPFFILGGIVWIGQALISVFYFCNFLVEYVSNF
jgi:hypothetical protein